MRLSRTYFEFLSRATLIITAAVTFAGAGVSATVTGDIEVMSRGQYSRGQQPDLSDLVVWLEPAKGSATVPVQAARVKLLQKNKTFTPHVLVIGVGTIVDFPNADPIFHSAFSNYNGQLFDLTLYPPGTTKSVRFRRPGIVRVFCNIHPSMSAIIVVLDTPYATKARADGRYQITNVVPGKYELHVFDERATGKDESPKQVVVTEEDSELQAPVEQISEEGYVPLSHKNKYGLEYPPEKDTDSYGGLPR
jgi:plastocyanin